MTFFSNIFNTSFLILLGIIVLSISLLFVYNESKIREQNHKMNSMLSLVSSLAEETNHLKNTLGIFMMNGGNMNSLNQNLENRQPFQINKSEIKMENNLITVSDDDEDDSDSDSNSVSNENETLDNSDDESDDESDNESESSDILDDSQDKIKILKIHKNIDKYDEVTDLDNDDLDNDNDDLDNDDLDNDDLDNDLNGDDIISIEGISLISDSEQMATEAILSLHNIVDNNNNIIITLHNFNQQNNSKNDNDNEHDIQILDEDEKKDNNEVNNYIKNDLKSISINQNNLEDKTMDNIDYKKLPINKLRNVVSEKGLILDSSKLKKNELLKLLGVE
jgi:hypothetical protein